MKITAPFTDEQVAHINSYQKGYGTHPFTCEKGTTLIASTNGFTCTCCDWKQDWCHEFMADGALEKALLEFKAKRKLTH